MNQFTQNAFFENRKDSDPDLVAQVTAVLSEQGHPNPSAWEDSATVQEAKVASPKLQRFLINRHWRVTLGRQGFNTTPERFCLQDSDCDHEQYMDVFKTHVAPTIVKHAL